VNVLGLTPFASALALHARKYVTSAARTLAMLLPAACTAVCRAASAALHVSS
jgi:hypothetical protein